METNVNHVSKVVMAILPSTGVAPRTQAHLNSLVLEMVNAKTEEAGWRTRSELQGVVNCLAFQGVVSEMQHDALGKAVGDIWRPLARQFATDRLSKG